MAPKLLLITSVAILVTACTQTNNGSEMELRNENPFPDFYINQVLKIQSLKPFINANTASKAGMAYQLTDSTIQNEFTIDQTNESTQIQVLKCSDQVVIISLLCSGYTTKSNDDSLGVVFENVPNMANGLAFYKYGPVKAWTHPLVFKSAQQLPANDIQFALWQYNDGTYACLVPMVGAGFVAEIGTFQQQLAIKASNKLAGQTVNQIPLVAIGFGTDPYKTIQTAYEVAFNQMGMSASLRTNKTYPSLFENMMWCTWNSFGHGVDEQKIREGLSAFKRTGIRIPNLLIDDGWYTVSAYGTGMLQNTDVVSSKFPQGLKSAIEGIKKDFNVQNIGVWHAYNGYWAGIDPQSVCASSLGGNLMPYTDRVAWDTKPNATFYFADPFKDSGKQFYTRWHAQLQSAGVSFVKIDNQLIMDRIAKGNYPFQLLASRMQQNMQESVQKYFNGAVINCMDMTTDAVYHFGGSAIGRSSEDYFPENTSFNITAGNEAIHVTCNAYNALWWSQMVWPDWDMFQTHRPNAFYHAIARSLSGGPIYVTDTPGMSDVSLLQRLMLQNGTVLRSDKPGVPTEDCLFSIGQPTPLKVFSISNGAGMLGVFNCTEGQSVSGFFTVAQIADLKGKNFALYNVLADTLYKVTSTDSVAISLKPAEAQLYIAKPITARVAIIGLKQKFNSPKTIIKETVADKMALVELAEGGTLLVYSEKKPLKIVCGSEKPLAYTYKNTTLSIQVPDTDTRVAIQF